MNLGGLKTYDWRYLLFLIYSSTIMSDWYINFSLRTRNHALNTYLHNRKIGDADFERCYIAQAIRQYIGIGQLDAKVFTNRSLIST